MYWSWCCNLVVVVLAVVVMPYMSHRLYHSWHNSYIYIYAGDRMYSACSTTLKVKRVNTSHFHPTIIDQNASGTLLVLLYGSFTSVQQCTAAVCITTIGALLS